MGGHLVTTLSSVFLECFWVNVAGDCHYSAVLVAPFDQSACGLMPQIVFPQVRRTYGLTSRQPSSSELLGGHGENAVVMFESRQ